MKKTGLALLLLVTAFVVSAFADANSLAQQAREMKEKGLYVAADSLYQAAIKECKDNDRKFDLLLEMADMELDLMHAPQDALAHIIMASELIPKDDPRQVKVHYRKGLAYEALGRYIDAADEFQTVVIDSAFRPSKKYSKETNKMLKWYSKQAMKEIDKVFAKNVPEVVAVVGGEPITEMELENRLNEIPPFYRTRYETPEGRKQLLEQLILERLMRMEAENQQLYLDSDVRRKLDQQRTLILQRALYDKEVRNKVNVTDDEIKKYYEEHKDEYKVPERVDIMRIVVKDSATADSLFDILKKAKGDSTLFDSLARQYSITPDGKRGGLLKGITKGASPKEISEAAFKMKPGELKMLKTSKGNFVVFKLLAKHPEKYRKLDEVKLSIEAKLKREKEKQLFEQLKQELRKKYGVEYKQTASDTTGTNTSDKKATPKDKSKKDSKGKKAKNSGNPKKK